MAVAAIQTLSALLNSKEYPEAEATCLFPSKHATIRPMNDLTNQIGRLQGRVHETMVRL